MQQISNLDLFFLIPELKALEGAFLNNVYESKGVLKFKFKSKNLIVDAKNKMYLSNYEFESEEPKGFVKFLRSELSNQKLIKIEQLDFDRVCVLTFTNSELIFEFVTGNIILVENGKIKAFLKESERIKKNKDYTPLKTKKHPFELNESDFDVVTGDVVPAVSKIVNLPVFYIEEACVRAGISGGIEKADKRKLIESLKGLLSVKAPRVYYENGVPKFFSSIPLKKLEMEFKVFPSLNEALDEYYSNQPKTSEKLLKLKFKLEQQKKALEEFKLKAKESRSKGEAIYKNYELVESILKNPEEAVKNKKVKKTSDERYVIIEV